MRFHCPMFKSRLEILYLIHGIGLMKMIDMMQACPENEDRNFQSLKIHFVLFQDLLSYNLQIKLFLFIVYKIF